MLYLLELFLLGADFGLPDLLLLLHALLQVPEHALLRGWALRQGTLQEAPPHTNTVVSSCPLSPSMRNAWLPALIWSINVTWGARLATVLERCPLASM